MKHSISLFLCFLLLCTDFVVWAYIRSLEWIYYLWIINSVVFLLYIRNQRAYYKRNWWFTAELFLLISFSVWLGLCYVYYWVVTELQFLLYRLLSSFLAYLFLESIFLDKQNSLHVWFSTNSLAIVSYLWTSIWIVLFWWLLFLFYKLGGMRGMIPAWLWFPEWSESTFAVESLTTKTERTEVVFTIENSEEQPTLFRDQFDAEEPIVFWKILPVLYKNYVSRSDFEKKTVSPIFTYVPKNNELYESFSYAYSLWMIWKDTNPLNQINCKTFAVLLWLAARREVIEPKSNDIFETYRSLADSYWLLDSCKDKENTMLGKDLP